MNILIVDDHEMNRKLLRVTLAAAGHSSFEAADGVQALGVLGRENISAVISDILMPNMDGFSLCHEIRKNEMFCALPFIFYTGTYTSGDDRKLAQAVGADRYITKPSPIDAILKALEEVTQRSDRQSRLPATFADEMGVLKQYNQTLVAKLEQKNTELQAALDRILELNHDLERRVQARTVELETANDELRVAFSEVKVLRGILPICSYCKKVRDDANYWESVENYITRHAGAKVSHACCPECFEQHVKPELDKIKVEFKPNA